MMKKTIILTAAAVLALTSCAHSLKVGSNDGAKRQFDAWIATNGYSDLHRTELGSYILESETGNASQPIGTDTDNLFVLADYTIRNLYSGTYVKTTDRQIAIRRGNTRNGDYDSTYFYGPQVRRIYKNYEYAGIEELVCSMNEGGRIKAFIPGWLMTTKRYDDAEEYLEKGTGDPVMIDISIKEKITDIKKWEVDSIARYLTANHPGIDPADTTGKDITKYGMYYIQTGKPSSDRTFPVDTTIYVNYTGRLLNGQVFDTSKEDLAKDTGLWLSTKTYKPVAVVIKEDVSKITMDGSTVISGFSYPLSKMHPHEKGKAIFYSGYGYKNQGSGGRIPAYSPLIFEFEIVDKP